VSGAFAGQTVVVTGGTRGLGRAVSAGFLEEGARVWATYREDERSARGFAAECERFAGALELARFDVRDYSAVEAFWARLEEQEPGGAQVLVHGSGIRRDASLALLSSEDWSAVIDTNLTGTFHMCRFAVRHMLARRYGRIVLISSPAAHHGFEGQAAYSASKAGQIGLMRSLAREVARKEITVNCVSPGFVDTELLADLGEEQRKRHLASVPLRRFGRPAEIAYAVRALASREASYITGATLEVAGGL
jgi:3-oxoacyl-[acyl-carrier protein] reductase